MPLDYVGKTVPSVHSNWVKKKESSSLSKFQFSSVKQSGESEKLRDCVLLFVMKH